ncbi:MAG: hypothetical protein ABI907_10215 [Ramlibacter sp.]
MHSKPVYRWLAALPLSAAFAASAQGSFQSALKDYQPFSEEKVAPWKESNDKVREVGGWRAYAREAQGKPEAAAPVVDPHAGHGQPAPKAKP